MEIQLNCPECRSFNVEIYKKDPNPFLNQHHYRCKDCGNIWRETLKILPDLNKNKKKELKMKIEKAKRNRIKYLKWGKIRMDDVINVLIDLFEFGGGKFSKRKKRSINNDKTKGNSNRR